MPIIKTALTNIQAIQGRPGRLSTNVLSRKSGKTAVTSLKVNGVSITNPTKLSNEFNNHFATLELARNIDSPDGDCFQRYITSTDQCFQLFFSLLNKLNKSKATGLDTISARLIWECADLICIPLCDIF